MRNQKYFFLSDAHLGSHFQGPDLREDYFIQFCDSIASEASALFLMGDIFDFWFEYRHAIPSAHFGALSALYGLRKNGVRIVYVGGNHDFWIGPFLSETLGIETHFEPITENLDGLSVWLSHGDGAIQEEWFYPLFKKVLRNPLNRRLYRLLHPDIGLPFAKFISSLSRRHMEKIIVSEEIKEKYRQAAKRLLKKNPWDAMVLAHTHFADLAFSNGKTYVNTGNWLKDFNYAVLENGKFSLHTFLQP